MSEELKNKNVENVQTKAELLKALESDFATSVNKVYINSIGKECSFREVTVQEQKSLTRMMSANERRKDIVYDAQCAIINKVALDPGFDVYNLTEFDRMKLLIALYQENMFQNEVKFTCEECGTENKYKVDFSNTIHKLDEYVLEEKDFHYENKNFIYDFRLAYPSVKLVSKFHASYCQKHGTNVPKRQLKANDVMTNLEYVNLFIKTIKMEKKADNKIRTINFADYNVSDIEDILSMFPQDVLYTEGGVLKYIVNNYIKVVNEAFDKHTCYQCGAVHEKGDVNSAESFF